MGSRCLRAEEIVVLSPIKYARRLISTVDDHPPRRTVKDHDTDVDPRVPPISGPLND